MHMRVNIALRAVKKSRAQVIFSTNSESKCAACVTNFPRYSWVSVPLSKLGRTAEPVHL